MQDQEAVGKQEGSERLPSKEGEAAVAIGRVVVAYAPVRWRRNEKGQWEGRLEAINKLGQAVSLQC